MNRIAIIDIGTNSIKHYIFEVSSENKSLVFYQRFSDAKLGENREFIESATQERALNIFSERKEKNDSLGVASCRLIGTDILRTASNAAEFNSQVEELFGAQVEILSQEKESYYLYRGLCDVVPEGSNFGAINAGGGSTEIIIGNTDSLAQDIRLSFGVNFLRQKFTKGKSLDWPAMDEYLDEKLDIKSQQPDYFFLSGILDFLQTVGPGLGFAYDKCSLAEHPIQMGIDNYREQRDVLRQTPLETLHKLYPENPHYGDNFANGQSIYYATAKKLGMRQVIPSRFEFTDGVVAEMAHDM